MLFADFGEPLLSAPALRHGRAGLTPAIPSNFGAVDVRSSNDVSEPSATTPSGGAPITITPPRASALPMSYSQQMVLSTASGPAAQGGRAPSIQTAPPPAPKGAAMPETNFSIGMRPEDAALVAAAGALLPVGQLAPSTSRTTLYIAGGFAFLAAAIGVAWIVNRD